MTTESLEASDLAENASTCMSSAAPNLGPGRRIGVQLGLLRFTAPEARNFEPKIFL